MSDEHSQDLAAMDALDMLRGEELAQWKAAVAADPTLAELEAQLRETYAQLAHLPPSAEPPAALRSRVLDSARSRPAKAPLAPVIPIRFYLGWAVAACLAVAALYLARQVLRVRGENILLVQQQRAADMAIESLKTEVQVGHILDQQTVAELKNQLAKKDALLAQANEEVKTSGDLARFKLAALTSLDPAAPKSVAVAVWDPAKQKGVLELANMPNISKDKDYQLWVIDPQYPIPVDGGVFRVDDKTGEGKVVFKAGLPVKSAEKFAISVERKGGVPKAQGPIVLLSQ